MLGRRETPMQWTYQSKPRTPVRYKPQAIVGTRSIWQGVEVPCVRDDGTGADLITVAT